MAKKLPPVKRLPVQLRPGFIPGGTFYSFTTLAQIQAFSEAVADRMDHPEDEPPCGRKTDRPPRMAK